MGYFFKNEPLINSVGSILSSKLDSPLTKTLERCSVVSIKRTGSLNYFEVFYHPELFFHVINEIFLPP